MTRTARNAVATATALAAALIALPARADHDDGRWRHDEHGNSPTVYSTPQAWAAPAVVVAHPAPPAYPARVTVAAPVPVRVVAVAPVRSARWEGGWRANELRREYRELERSRDRFYATWDGRPWTRARFESWYAARRADLDGRRAEIERWRR